MQHIKGGTLLSAQIVMSYAICKLNSLSVCDFTKYLLNEIHFSCKIYQGYETKNIFFQCQISKVKSLNEMENQADGLFSLIF